MHKPAITENQSIDNVSLFSFLPILFQICSYKTKILKPMADVKEDDILDNLPPCFEGGRRTMERVCTYARDVMFAQITQLFGDGSDETESEQNQSDRKAMALYLQACLQDYMSNGCKPPAFGEPFEGIETSTSIPDSDKMTEESQSDNKVTASTAIPSTGNVVIRRKTEEETTKQNYGNGSSSSSSSSTTTTSIRVRQPPRHERAIQQALGGQASIGANNSSAISELFQREHAPGIRKPGCPCCSPDDPSVLADSFLMM